MSNRRSAILYCICFLFVSSVLSGCISSENNETAVPTTTAIPTTVPPTTTEPPYTVQLADAWTLDIGGEPQFPPILVQDSICIVTEERILLVSGEGALLWDEPLSGEVRYAPITDGDSVYIVYSDGRVERRDGATGEIVWARAVDAYPPVPVCAYGERLYVSSGRYLLRLLAGTGDVVWRVKLPESPVYSRIVPCGDRLLVDTSTHNVTVVDADTGAILDAWDARCDMENLFVHDDSVYAMGGLCLTCLDADTGVAKWEYIFPGRGSWTPAFVDYPYAFVSTIDDQALCVSMKSGDLLWSDDAMYRGGLALSGDVLVSGIAYIPDMYKTGQGSWDPSNTPFVPERELVAWDVSTGARVMSVPADQGLKWPVAIGDRFVFVTGTSLACYAVEYGQ